MWARGAAAVVHAYRHSIAKIRWGCGVWREEKCLVALYHTSVSFYIQLRLVSCFLPHWSAKTARENAGVAVLAPSCHPRPRSCTAQPCSSRGQPCSER